MLPLCLACHGDWLVSRERARAATARSDFVRRMRAERETQPARPKTRKPEEEDDSWS